MTPPFNFNTPLLIVSADTHSAEILRNILASHDDFYTSNADLNTLWKLGNKNISHDLLTPRRHGSPKKYQKIRAKLFKILKQDTHKRIIDSSSGNIMRIAYLHKTIPEAKIIHIVRDGRSVVADQISEHPHNKEKSNHHAFGIAHFFQTLYGLLNFKSKSLLKNPNWPKMFEDTKALSRPNCYALQWIKANQAVQKQRDYIPEDLFLTLRYEDLIEHTGKTLDTLIKFIGYETPPFALWNYAKNTLPSQSHTSLNSLEKEEQQLVLETLSTGLIHFQYCEQRNLST